MFDLFPHLCDESRSMNICFTFSHRPYDDHHGIQIENKWQDMNYKTKDHFYNPPERLSIFNGAHKMVQFAWIVHKTMRDEFSSIED